MSKNYRTRSMWRAAASVVVAVVASLMALVAPAGAAPQSIALVKDILAGTSSSTPALITNVNGTAFFRATDGTGAGGHGPELWKSDGTPAGTVLVKDINPGTGTGIVASSGSVLINFNGTLYFAATDGVNGAELWKSDGTDAGTVMVTDINPGAGASSPADLTVVGSSLFFTANDGTTGIELWKTDGTAIGTVQVKDISAGSGNSSPTQLTNINGIVYFRATDGSGGHGIELWTSDGTTAGTAMVKDIQVGTGNSSPTDFALFNGFVYFSANDGTPNPPTSHGNEMWRTDGTEAGTTLFADINVAANSASGPFINYNGSLIFPASDGGAAYGFELWTTDGISPPVILKDINPGSTVGSTPSNFVKSNNILYFQALEATTGQELYKTDGTTAGTVLVKDVNPGTANGLTIGSLQIDFNNTLYFVGITGANDRELWRSDGTAAGTTLVQDLNPGTAGSFPTLLTNVNGTLLLRAQPSSTGAELYRLNNGPTAANDSYTTAEDTTLPLGAPGLLANDTDPDGAVNTLTAAKVTDPAHGTVTVNADGSFTYTPAANYNGPDSFTYKASDGSLDSVATVSLTVTSVADAPVAANDSYVVNTNMARTVSAPGVLANDTDGDGDAPTAVKVTDPAHGTVVLNANGSFTYTPAANYTGPDSFTYKANDGASDSNVATVNLIVSAPTIAASPSTVTSGSPVTATWSNIASPTATDWVGLYASSSDPDTAILAWAFTGGGAGGSLNLTVPVGATPAATYELRLNANNAYNRLATSAPFTVAGSGITVSASPSSVPSGGPVTAAWSGIASPSATDWIGLYPSSSTPEPGLLAWAYTSGAAAGNLNLTVPAGATPGATYELRLFTNNTYTRLATSTPFSVTASTTAIAASPSSVPAGSPVTGTWSGIASPTGVDWVGLYANSGDPDAAIVAWAYTGGGASGNLNLTVPVSAATGATYELRLFSNNSYTRLATSAPFSVTASAATISASPAAVAHGSPVTATWSGIGAPSAVDWVGLYANSSDPDPAILAWAYTGGAASGNLNLTVPFSAPAGITYELRLYANNSYTRLATSVPFTVT